MPNDVIAGVRIAGISAAVPAKKEGQKELAELFGERDARRLVEGTGIIERRVDGCLCTSDLCQAAADRLISELGWDRNSINYLILVTQTPDYVLPSTACILQDKLGLPTTCTAFDINLGCSGFVYGLRIVGKLLMPGQRALLLAGDTSASWYAHRHDDRSTAALFGDAGSAAALECQGGDGECTPLWFVGGTDGSGYRNIIVEKGQFRGRSGGFEADTTSEVQEPLDPQRFVRMNGPEVFAFAIREVPLLLGRTLELAGWSVDEVDDFILHQANKMMLGVIADKVGIPREKMPLSIEMFGNTSSASIPLTMVTKCRDVLVAGRRRQVIAGFGVGWSWAAMALETSGIVVPSLIEL